MSIDGKQPKHAGGNNVVTAVATPSQHYLGCELVEDKSKEIPAARKLIAKLELDGKLVSLDALHTCQATTCQIVMEAGASYLLTVKVNTSEIRKRIGRKAESVCLATSRPASGSHVITCGNRSAQPTFVEPWPLSTTMPQFR